jgi:hypothetical protein
MGKILIFLSLLSPSQPLDFTAKIFFSALVGKYPQLLQFLDILAYIAKVLQYLAKLKFNQGDGTLCLTLVISISFYHIHTQWSIKLSTTLLLL